MARGASLRAPPSRGVIRCTLSVGRVLQQTTTPTRSDVSSAPMAWNRCQTGALLGARVAGNVWGMPLPT